MYEQQRFFLIQVCLLLISFCVLWAFFPVGGSIDLALIHPWINETGQFPLKNDWFLAKLNHSYVKTMIIGVYSLFFLCWLASFKMEQLKPRRTEFGYFFWVSMLCTISIGVLKSHSAHACPWSMTLPSAEGFYWDFHSTQGHCFPGGHASAGFALMTGYFIYRQKQPARAVFFLISGLILGFLMGWAQMMRGAHFLSHNLWTGWVTWLINCVVYAVMLKMGYTGAAPATFMKKIL